MKKGERPHRILEQNKNKMEEVSLMESIDQLAAKLKDDVGDWERGMVEWICGVAQMVASALLERIDSELMKDREPGLEAVGFRKRTLITLFGDVRVRRRLYRDSEGNHRFLLDEAMGLDKGSRVSPRLQELATFLCSYLPFAKCERVLRALVPDGISHTTIHRLVGKVVHRSLLQEEREIAEVFERGVIPESEDRVVPYLMVEADGTSIALQREKERRMELKVGIAYEGWERVARDRYRLKERMSYSGVMDGERFWQGMSLKLAKRYNLSEVGKVIVGSDGAWWAKRGADFLGGVFQLDRFHLLRALYRALAPDDGLVGKVYKACISGDIEAADSLLREAQADRGGDSANRIAQLRGYLWDNRPGLKDYRLTEGYAGLRGLGAIEGNVDKLIASRMKKRGMSWTKAGANRMARLIDLRESGELHSWITSGSVRKQAEPPAKTQPLRERSTLTITVERTVESCFQAGLPALHGPHANHPWVRALRDIAHRDPRFGLTLAQDSPTKC